VNDPRALVCFDSADDAAVFRLGEAGDPDAETILSTMDFFTPVVESPYDFGRIAAANALSDIWAMGGEPLFALNIVGFPTKALPMDVLGEILSGGAAVAGEAGVPILGGHSTDFDVPVYGMAVTGRAKASRIRRNIGARPGDALVLTKAIGTGVLTSAMRAQALSEASLLGRLSRHRGPSPEEEAAAVDSMTRLNRSAARAADAFVIHASTDVTGYGLLGHLREVLAGSGVAAEVSVAGVPLLPGARRLAGQDVAPEGTRKNLASARPTLDVTSGVGEADLLLLADAQTSGGLLLSVAAEVADALVAAVRAAGDARAARIGRVLPASDAAPGSIRVVP
jgi:selenide,water dikinase